jgi:hypothetical protein
MKVEGIEGEKNRTGVPYFGDSSRFLAHMLLAGMLVIWGLGVWILKMNSG